MLEHYEVTKEIGRGAYGVVYKATQKSSNLEVAIKVIRDLGNPLVRRRTLREIKILQLLRHENIVSLLDAIRPYDFEAFSEACLVQEFMPHSLSQVISEQPLSEHQISYMTHQIFRGLGAIHAANIIHRDLKPDNILVRENCDLKICDFGLARAENAGQRSNIRMTMYVATRWYRAPEIMLSTYGRAADVWSVGCILAEMLRRVVLFPGKDYVDQLSQIFTVLGSPSKEDLQAMCSKRGLQFIQTFSCRIGMSWRGLCPEASNDVLDLLGRLLTFNPKSRITVRDALHHPFISEWGGDGVSDASREALSEHAFAQDDEARRSDAEVKRELFRELIRVSDESVCGRAMLLLQACVARPAA